MASDANAAKVIHRASSGGPILSAFLLNVRS